eukprot:25984-Eustigmatos_ZCMA.PRE.1
MILPSSTSKATHEMQQPDTKARAEGNQEHVAHAMWEIWKGGRHVHTLSASLGKCVDEEAL